MLAVHRHSCSIVKISQIRPPCRKRPMFIEMVCSLHSRGGMARRTRWACQITKTRTGTHGTFLREGIIRSKSNAAPKYPFDCVFFSCIVFSSVSHALPVGLLDSLSITLKSEMRRRNTPFFRRQAKLANVLPPLTDLTISAFDYFNNPYFFNYEADRTAFKNRSTNRENQQRLSNPLSDLFYEARSREENNGTIGAMSFLSSLIHGCILDRVMEGYDAWKEMKVDFTRMVDVDYEIVNRKLSHNYDLDRFTETLEDVFDWYEGGMETRRQASKKVGPYLCFVQSSGMGKTKIMYEYRKKSVEDEESDVASSLIMSSEILPAKKESVVFDFCHDFKKLVDGFNGKEPRDAALLVYNALDTILRETININVRERKERLPNKGKGKSQEIVERNKVTLMFDESQYLLHQHLGYNAFLFRCVRIWLREERPENVIAVFAGTTSKITKFLVEDDNELKPRDASSRGIQKRKVKYYDKGSNELYPLFYHTATLGSCLQLMAGDTEYDRAIFYGRPLFAIMADEKILHSKLSNVLCRMLIVLEGHDWKAESIAVINFLATRVQLGETSVDVVSQLVAGGYGQLAGCSDDCTTLTLAYLPDPVCARLAMCMMDEDYELVAPEWKGTIKGEKKQWWSGKMKEIFSTGLVSPSKGDLGEVVVALYMLFCGDVLRKEISNRMTRRDKDKMAYTQFSVSLDSWLDLLCSGGKVIESKRVAACSLSVGFIQVCRNNLRPYSNSWESLKDQAFLEHIFQSGIAFYVFDGCPLIDMVVPMRVNNLDGSHGARPKFKFVPLLVSIKSRLIFDQNAAETACEAMKTKAAASHLNAALCLLISFGSDPPSLQYTGEISIQRGATKVSRQLFDAEGNGRIVAKAVRVPENDDFKLTEAFRQMTPDSQVNTELFLSHCFIMAHGTNNSTDLLAENVICATSSSDWKNKYDNLREAMTNI